VFCFEMQRPGFRGPARPVEQFYLILRGVSNPALLVVEQIARRLVIDLWVLLGVEPKPGPSCRKVRVKGGRASK
jgi:hypothetical protein